jgi:ubiquinone/menaquinone biosynthesis C-methylase UbiE
MQPSFWIEAQSVEQLWWRNASADMTPLLMKLAESAELVPWVDSDVTSGSVLELGIGPLAIGLGSLLGAARVVGVDTLPLMTPQTGHGPLDRFLLELQHATEYLQADATTELPFPASSFDLVVCDNVVDHTQDPGAVLREARRLTKPGGTLILGVNVFSIIGLYRRRYITAVLHPHRGDVVSHHHTFIPRQVDALLTACGWRPEATSSVGLPSGLFGRVHRYRVRARTGRG